MVSKSNAKLLKQFDYEKTAILIMSGKEKQIKKTTIKVSTFSSFKANMTVLQS